MDNTTTHGTATCPDGTVVKYTKGHGQITVTHRRDPGSTLFEGIHPDDRAWADTCALWLEAQGGY